MSDSTSAAEHRGLHGIRCRAVERIEDVANTRRDLAVEFLILPGSVTRILISLSFIDICGIA